MADPAVPHPLLPSYSRPFSTAYKIQIFETNLNYGHKYFEDTLLERDKLVKEKLNDCNRLKNQLNELQLDHDYARKSLEDKCSELDRLKANYDDLLQYYNNRNQKAGECGLWDLRSALSLAHDSNRSDEGDELHAAEAEQVKSLKCELQQREGLLAEKERFIQKLQTQIDLIEVSRNENEELKNSDLSLVTKIKDNYDVDLKNLKGE